MNFKHDSVFLEILREKKDIASFLDYFFGFLHRCTDFYLESTPSERLGFAPGVAGQLVFDAFQKWKNVTRESQLLKRESPSITGQLPVTGIGTQQNAETNFSNGNLKKPKTTRHEGPDSSESYNGASCENYSWSQSISDLEVLVRVPREVQNSKQLQILLSADTIEVAFCAGTRETLIKGRLSFEIKNCDSFWCLDPGRHVTLHLEKARERWWESLLEDEPRIELSKIDCSRRLEELGEDEQMKVEELMWNQRRKLLEQSTPEQISSEWMLERGWRDSCGSHFRATPSLPPKI